MPSLIEHIASDSIIDQAYAWLCQQRQEYSPNSDIWNLRRDWQEEKTKIQHLLLAVSYCFSPQQEIRFPEERLAIWTAQDSLVLKSMPLVRNYWHRLYLRPVAMWRVMAGRKIVCARR